MDKYLRKTSLLHIIIAAYCFGAEVMISILWWPKLEFLAYIMAVLATFHLVIYFKIRMDEIKCNEHFGICVMPLKSFYSLFNSHSNVKYIKSHLLYERCYVGNRYVANIYFRSIIEYLIYWIWIIVRKVRYEIISFKRNSKSKNPRA